MKHALAALAVVALLAASAAPTLGAPAFAWPGAPSFSQYVADADEGLTKTAREILSAEYAVDGSFHHFRITLKDAPSGIGPNDNWAGNYGIYISIVGQAGGWSFQDTDYLPYNIQGLTVAQVSNIHIALDGHWNYAGSGPQFATFAQHNHVALASPTGVFSLETLSGFNPQPVSEGGPGSSNVLEFKLSDFYLPLNAEFNWFAATLDTGSEFGTYDVTNPVFVPEPSTMALIGIGLAGLVAGRRKSQKA